MDPLGRTTTGCSVGGHGGLRPRVLSRTSLSQAVRLRFRRNHSYPRKKRQLLRRSSSSCGSPARPAPGTMSRWESQWRHLQRSWPPVPRHLRQRQENAPKAGVSFWVDLTHWLSQRRKSTASRRPHAPTRPMTRTNSFLEASSNSKSRAAEVPAGGRCPGSSAPRPASSHYWRCGSSDQGSSRGAARSA